MDPELILNLPHETEWREAIGNSKRGNLRHAAKAIGYLIVTRTTLRFLAENPRSILYVDIPGRDWKLWEQFEIRRDQPLPMVLTRDEVHQLLGAVRENRFKAVRHRCSTSSGGP